METAKSAALLSTFPLTNNPQPQMTMTTPNQLLVLLKERPSTTDACAARVGVPMLVAKAMLERLAKEGLASSFQGGELLTWKITPAGLELAISLKKHAA